MKGSPRDGERTVSASPNPASWGATIRGSAPATVAGYDVLGRTVQTKLSGEAAAGLNEVSLPTGSPPAGVYVVRVTAGRESAAVRFTVVR